MIVLDIIRKRHRAIVAVTYLTIIMLNVKMNLEVK